MIADRSPSAQKLLETFIRFRRLHWRQQNQVAGLTTSEVIILSHIRHAEDCEEGGAGTTVSELSSLLNVASPTITQQINSLETNGLVERSIDKGDRRVVRIKLTEKGAAVQHKAFERFLTTINGLVEYLGEEDSNRLAGLMVKVFTYFTELSEADQY